MKDYATRPAQAARTIQSATRSSRQAPVADILQQYQQPGSFRNEQENSNRAPGGNPVKQDSTPYAPGTGQPVIQAVWDTDTHFDAIVNSQNDSPSNIVATNIEVQQEAVADHNGQQMRDSGQFSATGYEFEFAQLAPDARDSEFAKKSHMELARGNPFPLYPHIPFSVETDMASVIELAMPPILVPRDSETKQVDRNWIKTVLLKLETALKSLARNSTSDLNAMLAGLRTFFHLDRLDAADLPDSPLKTDRDAARYGFMQKNSRRMGKYTTAQANVVTTLKEAIELAYRPGGLPNEINQMKVLFEAHLPNPAEADPNNYRIFIAQKLSEIPYMFFDALHSLSLAELADPESARPVFSVLRQLVGHESNRRPENKVHRRPADDAGDDTLHTARTVVSRVKNRSTGWIKSTLGQQLHLFPEALITAGKNLIQENSDQVKETLRTTVAYRALESYAEISEAFPEVYNDFLDMALNHYLALFDECSRGETDLRNEEAERARGIRGQLDEDPEQRAFISSARPDTVIILDQSGAAYRIDPENDAVLVEIRQPSAGLGIRFGERTTNKPSRNFRFIRRRAERELRLFSDRAWVAAYEAVNPENTETRRQSEIAILTLLSTPRLDEAGYQEAYRQTGALIGADPASHIYWKKWFEPLRQPPPPPPPPPPAEVD